MLHKLAREYPELEKLIISKLDPLNDYVQLLLVNKRYHRMITNSNTYKEMRKFANDDSDIESAIFDFDDQFDNINILFDDDDGLYQNELSFIKACTIGHLMVAELFFRRCPDKIL